MAPTDLAGDFNPTLIRQAQIEQEHVWPSLRDE